MGMRRAGRPELEHRQVRTEFEHQRCELRSSAGAEREHRRNDVPWECDGPEGRSLSTARCERSSSTRGASCDSRWVQPMPSGTPPVRPTTRSSSATTAGRTQRPDPELRGETYYAQLKCHDPSGVSKPFGLLLLLPHAMLPPVATPTSPSPKRPSGSRPTRTMPSATRSRPGPTPCPHWRERGDPPFTFNPRTAPCYLLPLLQSLL
jgi:hypothetical protein